MFTRLSVHRIIALLVILILLSVPLNNVQSAPGSPISAGSLQNGPQGSFIDPEQQVSTPLTPEDPNRYRPDAAYDPEHGRFLVVWHQTYSGGHAREIYGQLVLANGKKFGPPIVVASRNTDTVNPAVVYSKTSHEYLVVFMYDVTGDGRKYDLLGQFVTPNGDLVGGAFTVLSVENVSYWSPRLAWSSQRDEFLLVFGAVHQDTQMPFNIGMIVIGADGTFLYGTTWGSDSEVPTNPDVVFDGVNNQYLIVWSALNSSGKNVIRGSLRDNIGNEIQAVDIYGTTTNDSIAPRVSSSIPTLGLTYLVTFEYVASQTDHDIYAAWVSSDGATVLPFTIDTSAANETSPAIAGRQDQFGYLVTYQRADISGSKIINWGPSFPTTLICDYFSTNCLLPSIAYGGKTFLNTYVIELPVGQSAVGGSSITLVVQHVFDRAINVAAIFMPMALKK